MSWVRYWPGCGRWWDTVDSTLRYRAASRIPYARALLTLADFARTSTREFVFGPLSISALEANGLAITGPDAEQWADDLMKGIAGLHRSDE